nr:MAG TPA: hypothetical protein [Bacteriophage sp.]
MPCMQLALLAYAILCKIIISAYLCLLLLCSCLLCVLSVLGNEKMTESKPHGGGYAVCV